MTPHFQPPPEIAEATVPAWAIASAVLLAAALTLVSLSGLTP